jgi:hypothetical protein
MKEENIVFIKQLLNSLENKLEELNKAKEDNDPKKFSELKKEILKINNQIGNLIK